MFHHKILHNTGGIHTPFNWVVADEAARDALVVSAADIYKACWQVDTGSIYILTNHSPVTWEAGSGGSGGSSSKIVFRGHINANQTGLSSTGGFTKVQLTVKDIDTHNFFDAVTNFRFQPNDGIARYFQISYSLFCRGTSLTYAIGCPQKNGIDSAYGAQATSQANAFRAVGIDTIVLNGSTDYLELGVYTLGSGIYLDGGTAPQTTCSIVEIGTV